MQATFTKFALVVPTLNEEESIKALLDRTLPILAELNTPSEILVVDDESSDRTQQIVQEYTAQHGHVRLISRTGKHGLAGAIVHGWQCTSADLLGVIDADLQHPPDLLPSLIRKASEGFDLVIASRYLQADSMNRWNWTRKFLSRLGVLASAPVQRKELKVSDPLSGFFVVRRMCIAGITFQESGFKLLLDVLARARVNSVCEIPFEFGPRRFGKSKANTMTAVHYLVLLSKLALGRKPGKQLGCS